MHCLEQTFRILWVYNVHVETEKGLNVLTPCDSYWVWTNLPQYIEKIVKPISESTPFDDRPSKFGIMKERSPEVWLYEWKFQVRTISRIFKKDKTSWICLLYLAESNRYKNAIGFQNIMNTFKHCHELGYCCRLWIPLVTTVHKQYILQTNKMGKKKNRYNGILKKTWQWRNDNYMI